MTSTTNCLNSVEDADMADCDEEKVVTMVDVLKEQEDFEENANAVLGASDDKNCTYNMGYVKRQAIYACVTCCSEAKTDPSKRAGVCLACSLTCHESHELIELYTKRNFRCDCGNSKFNSHPCQFMSAKKDLNDNNSYNQNFSGLYCTCHRPYPDPEYTVEDDMIHCIICEDWFHATHLEATVPGNDKYSEMICKGCMESNPFLHDYSDLAVIVENSYVDILNVDSSNCTKLANGDTKDKKLENDIAISDTSTSSRQIPINDVEMVVSCEKNDTTDKSIDNIVQNDDDKQPDTLEEQCSTEINSDQTDEMRDNNVNMEHNKEDQNKVAENQLHSQTDQEKHSSEISTATNEINAKVSIEVTERSEVELSNEENEKSITSKIDVDESENDIKPPNTLGAEKMEEAGLSLEDNIQDLRNLINENNETDKESKLSETATNKPPENENALEVEKNEILNVSASNDKSKTNIALLDSTGNESINSSAIEDTKSSQELEVSNSTEDLKTHSDINSETEEAMDSKDIGIKNESNSDQLAKDQSQSIEVTQESTNTEIDNINSAPQEKSQIESESSQSCSNNVSESNIVPSENESSNKRKISAENTTEEIEAVKRTKPNELQQCVRPRSVKRIYKGATFWPPHFRQKLCTCNECLTMYKDLDVLFLIDLEDTIAYYENLGKEKVELDGKPKSQYEKGLEALSSLDRVQQINALTEYNRMRDKLLDFLKSFKDKKEIVKEEDIKAFFANMKPKREPDGVYFCR